MINIMTRLVALPILLQALAFSAAQAQETISFDVPDTSVTGKLLRNYVGLGSGEILKGTILYLSEPVTIEGNANSENRADRKTVRNIQHILIEFESADAADDALGGVVQLSGRLHNQPSGPHHTKVLMNVDTLTIIEEMTGEGPVATFKTH